MRRPIWFLNMCAVSDWTGTADTVGAMIYWSPHILRYLDETHVVGNDDAEAVCRVLWKLWHRSVDISKLTGDFGGLSGMVQVNRRLRGLTKQ